MKSRNRLVALAAGGAVVALGMALAQPPAGGAGGAGGKAAAQPSSERTVKESEVPGPALAALKKLAAGAAFTEFAEEVEHGHTFYEGSWRGPHGNVDALVTPGGDIVEIEESMPPDGIPAGVRAAAEKEAGKEGVAFERKTLYLYEIHWKKDGKGHEAIFTTDGRRYHEEGQGDEKDEDDEEKK
jgi:hypothetical protein